MARYKHYDYSQGKFIPISFDKRVSIDKNWFQNLQNILTLAAERCIFNVDTFEEAKS